MTKRYQQAQFVTLNSLIALFAEFSCSFFSIVRLNSHKSSVQILPLYTLNSLFPDKQLTLCRCVFVWWWHRGHRGPFRRANSYNNTTTGQQWAGSNHNEDYNSYYLRLRSRSRSRSDQGTTVIDDSTAMRAITTALFAGKANRLFAKDGKVWVTREKIAIR